MTLPIELLDYILSFGFSWMLNFRLINKEMKERVDKVIRETRIYLLKIKQSNVFIFNYSYYNVLIESKIRNNILLLSLISEINHVLKVNRNQRISNTICISLYDMVFYTCAYYHLNDTIYSHLERLFDISFQMCLHEGELCIAHVNHIKRFYKCIFGGILYYARKVHTLNINDLLEERLTIQSEYRQT